MSRQQRRLDRKQGARTAAAPRPVNRRTPVKARGATSPPWALIGIVGGAIAVVGLVVYLIVQSTSGDAGLSASDKAERDSSTDLPGVFYPSQGRKHFNYTYSPDRAPHPFCAGVPSAASPGPATPQASATVQPTVAATSSPASSTTPEAQSTASGSPRATATPRQDCYATNPPTSGQHLPPQASADLGNGIRIKIPPDPDVYPTDVVIPRDAIAHIEEHAGVFVGYNCADGDNDCQDAVQKLQDVVNDRIDNHRDRVVMGRDPDLPVGTFGLAAWTRLMTLNYQDFEAQKKEIARFIGTHSCRFDPEGFCK